MVSGVLSKLPFNCENFCVEGWVIFKKDVGNLWIRPPFPLPAQIYHINKYFANGFSAQTFDSNSQTLLCGRLEGICKRQCQSVACKF